ncbi:hypothetical protein EVAR_35344_1 [Eumeta japonica]|uniref:Uncharacterized protein n=1 Tax=Eumeta variegata TaxID=151549 RepID=A0A4C1XLS5_EUMVA|nr:hypothetical protein EVAR_35344_1 [Eumeta japonica]
MGARRTATRRCIFCTFNGCKEDGDAALYILRFNGVRGQRRGGISSFNGCKEDGDAALYSAVLMGARRTATRRCIFYSF